MTRKQRLASCRGAAPGKASGEALVSSDAMCFYLAEPETGVVIEDGHALQGQSVAGKVLVFPSGKGSSVVQADGLYQLAKHGNAPAAMIVKQFDPVLVASAVIMGVPLVGKVQSPFFSLVGDGDHVEVDADTETIVF
jgi:predicted aconitase with swiveling domain